MTKELLPCPFCGSTDIRHSGLYIECMNDNCMTLGPNGKTSELTGEAWNRRAPSASIADTAGAKPVAWRWRLTAEINGKQWGPGPWEYTINPEKFDNRTLYEVEPLYATPPAPSVADAAGARPVVIDDMVSRFLGWKLPQDFYPDCFVTFDREKASAQGSWPVGTNLLHAGQARAMLEHVLAAPSVADAACVDCQENCQTCGIYKKSGSNRAMSFEEFCDLHIDAQDTIDRAWLRNFTRLWDVFRQGDPSSVADAAIDCGECACFPGICDKEEALKVADAAGAMNIDWEHLYNEMAKRYSTATIRIAELRKELEDYKCTQANGKDPK